MIGEHHIAIHLRTSSESSQVTPIPAGRGVRAARHPYDGCVFVVADGACPDCRATSEDHRGPAGNDGFEVVGGRIRITTDRDEVADAVCRHCNEHIGALRVVFQTLFGREEDRRVLAGRCRVY